MAGRVYLSGQFWLSCWIEFSCYNRAVELTQHAKTNRNSIASLYFVSRLYILKLTSRQTAKRGGFR